MKKVLIALLIVALSISSAQAGECQWKPCGPAKAHGVGHGSGNPHMIICQIFSVYDWKWCRGDWK